LRQSVRSIHILTVSASERLFVGMDAVANSRRRRTKKSRTHLYHTTNQSYFPTPPSHAISASLWRRCAQGKLDRRLPRPRRISRRPYFLRDELMDWLRRQLRQGRAADAARRDTTLETPSLAVILPALAVDPNGVYRPAQVIAALGLCSTSLRTAWRRGELRIVRRCGRFC
jgi:hypothetical protein